ncbi:hypothetical protein WMF26_18710 [Sorangium sp. So ce185]|uniref:hypothetical protein n=1 Tax=Sorangium sp. So ce185 TaxID=3133287 RepID=UPI003F646E88
MEFDRLQDLDNRCNSREPLLPDDVRNVDIDHRDDAMRCALVPGALCAHYPRVVCAFSLRRARVRMRRARSRALWRARMRGFPCASPASCAPSIRLCAHLAEPRARLGPDGALA